VRLGELEFDNDQDDAQPEDFGVLALRPHPDFENPKLYNDIAVVKLDREVQLSKLFLEPRSSSKTNTHPHTYVQLFHVPFAS